MNIVIVAINIIFTFVIIDNHYRPYNKGYICSSIAYKMKSTLKVHNPRVTILLIRINDVQGKELSFQVCNIIMKVIDNIQQPSLLAVQSHSDSQL